jgi:hypothetical protein
LRTALGLAVVVESPQVNEAEHFLTTKSMAFEEMGVSVLEVIIQ